MQNTGRKLWSRYALAVIATLVALLAYLFLRRWLVSSSPFTYFIPAVMLSAWYGGFGPGLFATLAGALLGNCLLVAPMWDFSTGTQDIGRMLLFSVVGWQISWLSGALHNAKRSAETDARAARRSEKLYRTLASQNQASADGILAVADDGKIIFSNRRFSEIWDIEPLNGTTDFESLRDRLRDQLDTLQVDPLSTTKSELSIDQPAGSEELNLHDDRTIERYSAAIIGDDGSSFGRVWFFRDITDRKRMQKEIIEASERERQRIGQDLHDDLCQQMAGIACLARALQQHCAGRSDPNAASDAAALAEIVDMVNLANQRARDLAKGMQPVNLQQRGLATALEELCESIQDVFDVTCIFRGETVIGEVPQIMSIQLYRVAQEAISNAIRHGKARKILVDLLTAEDRIILTVEDDGSGIPSPVPRGGMGLSIMNYRAHLIGGVLSVDTEQPRGTTVICSVPIKRSTSAEVLSSQPFVLKLGG